MKIYANEIGKYLGKKIEFLGWVHSIRTVGKISFVVLRDKTGFVQATFKKEILKEEYKKIKEIAPESILKVYGEVKEKPKGGYEIIVESFEILNPSEPLPIEIWNLEIKTEFIKRVQYRFLDLRRKEIYAIFKIRSDVIQYFREFLLKEGFLEMQTPKIVLMGAESGAEVFRIDYFGKEAYLAQSPQLYKQMLMASGIDKYFEFGWYWRAEKSHTSRHLTEFYALDLEIAWIKDYNEILDLAEKVIKYVLNKVEERNQEELSILNVTVEVPKEIPRITIKEAYKLLEKTGKKLPYGSDLDTEAEKLLGETVKKEYDSDLVFVTEYPWEHRPFYTMRKEDEPEWTYSYDCLFKGLEIFSGSQREHRYEKLIQNIKEKGISMEPLKYYLEAFKYGMPPHGGLGLGIDRFVKQLLNLKDIREAVLWFRDPEHILP